MDTEGASETGLETETGVEPGVTETETGEPECPEAVQQGNVAINGLETLELLDGVTRIEGNVELTGEFGPLEAGLEQLRCLDEITGFLFVHDTDLVDFTGLERLEQIGDYFYVGQTFALRDFAGLSGLRRVGSSMQVTENSALLSTLGMDLFVELGSFLFVNNNPQLQDLLGFSQLGGLDGLLRIENNGSLQTLAGLDNLRGVGGDFGIINNFSLFDTSALERVERIGGNLLWQNNPGVASLNLDSLLTVRGYFILSNMSGLVSVDDLFGLQGINNQLFIWGTGLGDIDGFVDLEFLGGDVWIEENPNLAHVDGLISLVDVPGSVRIEQNPSLVSAEGLANLRNVQGGVSLWGNPQLQVLALDNLEFVGEYFRIGYAAVNSVSAPKLEIIGEDMLVFGANQLTGFDGFDALTTVGGRIDFRDNEALTSLSLPALEQVFGRVQFINNDALPNLDGLASLSSAGGVNIRENFLLVNVNGLSGLTQVSGLFKLVENEALFTLAGLNGLTQIGGDFEIRGNSNLTLIPGLQNLNAVGGDVGITNNIDLPTCTATALVGGIGFIGGSATVAGNLPDSCGG